MLKQINLVKKTYTADSIGNLNATISKRTVFADIKSISGQEFANAGQNGIKPALVFVIWTNEYDNEEEIEYGIVYSIYRRYVRDDGRIELYTEERVGQR